MKLAKILAVATLAFAPAAFAGNAAVISAAQPSGSSNTPAATQIAVYNNGAANPVLFQRASSTPGAVVDAATGAVTVPVTLGGQTVQITVDSAGNIIAIDGESL